MARDNGQDIQEYLTDYMNNLIKKCDESGTANFEACDAWYHGWDKDVYAHRHTIASGLSKRGYKVESKLNWGVCDYSVTKIIDL